jgi:hypothetical protein
MICLCQGCTVQKEGELTAEYAYELIDERDWKAREEADKQEALC